MLFKLFLVIFIFFLFCGTEVQAADSRFQIVGGELGGVIDPTSRLGISGAKIWGYGRQFVEKQYIQKGKETVFTVGMAMNCEYIIRNTNGICTIDQFGQCNCSRNCWSDSSCYVLPLKCKRSITDSAIVNCQEVPLTGVPNDVSFDYISQIIGEDEKYKGQVWQIGYEPDNWPYLTPEDYAVWFHLFRKEILRVDPTAKIMIGGLFNTPLSEIFIKRCQGGSGYESWPSYDNRYFLGSNNSACTSSSQRFWWLNQFRQFYLQTYAQYPPVDIWDIHADWVKEAGNFDNLTEDQASNLLMGYIQEFRNWLDSNGEISKPIWMTELGIPIPDSCKTCLTQQQRENQWRKMSQIAKKVTDWLMINTQIKAEKWFWYGWIVQTDWNNRVKSEINTFKNLGFSFLTNVDEPDLLAINYAKLAKSALLFNSSFEAYPYNGKLDFYLDGKMPAYAWSYINGGPGTDYQATFDSNANSGERSIKVHVGNEEYGLGYFAAIHQIIPSDFYAGKIINLSSWTKTESACKTSLEIGIINSQNQTNHNFFTQTPQIHTDWTQITTGQVLIPQDTISLEIKGKADGRNCDVWFDDMNLSVVESCVGNLNSDDVVNLGDLSIVLSNWGSAGLGDLNEDGIVNLADISEMLSFWGNCNR